MLKLINSLIILAVEEKNEDDLKFEWIFQELLLLIFKILKSVSEVHN